jgi:hypothetical protein
MQDLRANRTRLSSSWWAWRRRPASAKRRTWARVKVTDTPESSLGDHTCTRIALSCEARGLKRTDLGFVAPEISHW